MPRKSPEEKAARRRAAFEKRVAQTASRDAQSRADAERAIETEKAQHAANVAFKARQLSGRGRPFTFTALGILVLDDVVYVNEGGLRQLGPLAGAAAHVTRLSPREVHRSAGTQLVFGAAAVRKVERAAIVVVAAGTNHQRVIEERWAGDVPAKRAEREARDFNELARQVGSSLPSLAGAGPVGPEQYTTGTLPEHLERVRSAIADVSRTRERLDLQMKRLAEQQIKVEDGAREASRADREDLARQSMLRSQVLQKHIAELKAAFDSLQLDEENLIAMVGRLQSRIDASGARQLLKGLLACTTRTSGASLMQAALPRPEAPEGSSGGNWSGPFERGITLPVLG